MNILGNNFSISESLPKFVARIYILEDILEKCSAVQKEYFDLNSIHCGIYMSDDIRINLRLKVGSRVIVEIIEKHERSKPSVIHVFPFNESTITTELFKNYMKIYSRYEELLLNAFTMISLDDDNRFHVKMLPENCNYAMINEKDIEDLTIQICSPIHMNDEVLKIPTNPRRSLNLEKISGR